MEADANAVLFICEVEQMKENGKHSLRRNGIMGLYL
jgi:hypothetical protein